MGNSEKWLLTGIACSILISGSAWGHITIGKGEEIGRDKRGTIWHEEFQDWTTGDLKGLDSNNDQYKFDDTLDTSRDLIAFYTAEDANNIYFRMDFYDLALGAEDYDVDVYVAIDCADGGEVWLPDYSDSQTDMPWEVVACVYNSTMGVAKNARHQEIQGAYLGSYWHSELDAVEFAVTKKALRDAGWNGELSRLNFQPYCTRDGTENGAGHIVGRSDLTDAVGALIDPTGAPGEPDCGVLRGHITWNASTGRAKYAVIAHANQSVNTQGGTMGHIYTDRSDKNLHPGFIRLLDSAEMLNVPVNLHISGSLIMSFLWAVQDPSERGYPDRDGPTFLARCKRFVTEGPGSLIGGVLAEHIMPYFEGEVNAKSIQQNSELIEHSFGLTEEDMKVMHVPERVIRTQTNHPHVSPDGPLTGKTFAEIANSGYSATYLDEVTHLHWWFYPNEAQNPGWDDYNYGRWAGGGGNDEEVYHHKLHRVNGVLCFMINDREDQSKFGNHDGGMAHDTRYTLLQKALHADSSQITIVFDDWEAFAGNSFASPDPNNNADQFHATLRWAANHPWIELKNLKDVVEWAEGDDSWVIDHGYVYDQTAQTYEWLKRASEHTYDTWYYGSDLEESFFERVPRVHSNWAPDGMKKYGDMNTPGSLLHDSWATIQSISNSPRLKKLSEWAFSAMIYETAWHDEDANPNAYQSRNYQVTFNREETGSYEDRTYDALSGWAIRLHGHVRDTGVMKAADDWLRDIRSGAQGVETRVWAADVDDDQLEEYILCNNKVFLCFERWGARLIKAFVYDEVLNDAILCVGAPMVNPSEETEEERADSNRCSAFKDRWSTEMESHIYVDLDFASPTAPTAGRDYWEFVSSDGKIRKRMSLPAGHDVVEGAYTIDPSLGTLYTRFGLGPNQLDLMFNGVQHLSRGVHAELGSRGLRNSSGGEAYVVRGRHTEHVTNAPSSSGWDGRNMALTEQFEMYNASDATSYSYYLAFSEQGAADVDGDGVSLVQERTLGTDPFKRDTDGDELWDGDEVASGSDPLDASVAYLSTLFHPVAFTNGMVIPFQAVKGRTYQIRFAEELEDAAWDWQAFENTNAPFGTYHAPETGSAAFTDRFDAATSGGVSAQGRRLYQVTTPLP
jgi:hypothetical protein